MKRKTHSLLQDFTRDIDKTLIVLLVFLLPFERIPSLDVGGITLRLSFVVAVMIISRALYLVVIKRQKVEWNLSIALLAILVGWMIILLPFALNTKRALEATTFTGFTVLTSISIYYLYKPKYLLAILKALLISAGIVLLFGFYQYFANLAKFPEWLTGLRDRYSWEQFGFPRIQSVALEPLYYVSYLLIPFSVASVFLLSDRPQARKIKKLFVVVLLASSASIFLTVSRGGIAALIVALVALIILTSIFGLTNLRRAGGVTALVLGGFIISLIMINFINKPPQNLLLTKGKKGTSAYTQQLSTTGLEGGGDERAQTRKQAIDIIKSSKLYMIVGTGPGQFGPHVQGNQKGGGWFIVNNLTLELWVELGIIGLLLFLGFVGSLLLRAWNTLRKSHNSNQKLVVIALSAYVFATAVQYQTFSTLYIMHIWAAIGLLMALTKNYGKAKE